MRVIAEIKRKSPSKGLLNARMKVSERAGQYVAAGAAALSILTEEASFDGSPADLREAAIAVPNTPLLKKDFHIDAIQLGEARLLGASAALLIARALPPGKLEEMVGVADSLGLETLVEIRNEDELQRAVGAGARIIGVNNRDLETLVIDPATSKRLIPQIPSDCIAIAESGMNEVGDVEGAARAGADAVLVGSSLSSSSDPDALIRAFSSIPTRPRAS